MHSKHAGEDGVTNSYYGFVYYSINSIVCTLKSCCVGKGPNWWMLMQSMVCVSHKGQWTLYYVDGIICETLCGTQRLQVRFIHKTSSVFLHLSQIEVVFTVLVTALKIEYAY